ncbi:zinc finger protein 250 isoform X2 [Bicyclus anynana]|uniref:Zinc finger protein 250 isoform X2 n=1 Tax=Bicyclus anynana TaxID=110368 RepID=A0ABM3M1W8_BICAN|nr:zinc finger protein 250 isoform X2 [Bicyclus anynana]
MCQHLRRQELPFMGPFGAGPRWSHSSQPSSLQKLSRPPRSPNASWSVAGDPMCAARCSDTPLHLSITCIGVSSSSMHALQRGLSVIPRTERLPSEGNLRTALLRALGVQDHHLPDTAVVCSQHFVDENFLNTNSSVREIHSNAVPSTVQMCMICLDTDSKLSLMSKHKLEEAYKQLTGLSNTVQHKELMNCTTAHLKCNLTQTTLEANHCDLYIDHTDEEELTAAEESVVGDIATVVVKNEGSSDSMSCADNLELAQEDDNHKDSSNSGCASDDEYSDRSIETGSLKLNDVPPPTANCVKPLVAPLFVRLSASNENKMQATEESGAIQKSEQILETNIGKLDNRSSESGTKPYIDINRFTNCVVQLCDIFKKPNKVVLGDNQRVRTHTAGKLYSCEMCTYKCALKSDLLRHIKIHTDEKPFSWELCNYKCAQKGDLIRHIKTHTGEKPFSCELCNYKCAQRGDLIRHIKTHTGEKPFSCELCNYKCAQKGDLSHHKKTHTDEKPFSCELCNYKCAYKSSLLKHIKTHTGDNPRVRTHTADKLYSCEICTYKCAKKSALLKHKITHTGEKPFSCDICNYKFARKSDLIRHIKTHTGEKPFSCELCNYKCAKKCYLSYHKKIHTGEKPFSCEICNFKCAHKNSLLRHKKTHTGEKPFSCEICNYKFARKFNLLQHIKTHTGEKTFSCELCSYKCARKSHLLQHFKTHTGVFL